MDIRIGNLIKTFGKLRANDAISLHFASGQVHGILGENGAGKSTLMKILSGVLPRDAGEIVLDGRPARLGTPAAALKAGIGMVYQDPLDVPAFSVLENFVCASPRGLFPTLAAARHRLEELAGQLAFAIDAEAPVASLTVGQRQQLELVRLLAWGMQVLILDEPTTGITATQRDALFGALRLLASRGHTVLFVSHKLEEIVDLCDTASVLRSGQVMGEGQMEMPQPREKLLSLMFEQVPSDPLHPAQLSPVAHTQPSPAHPDASAPPSPPVWQLEQVTIGDGSRELRDLTLTIPAGKIVGLAGVVGSGQHLLLRLLAGNHVPDHGRMLLQGHEQNTPSAVAFRQEGIAFLPADRLGEGLIGALSLTEHILLLKKSSFLANRAEAHAEARAAIATYDIRGTPDTPLNQLSGGNQQRAMLALIPAYCRGLLLEQPTRGLDVTSARNIWQQLLKRRAEGAALVFASADLDELLAYSDAVMVFFGGKVSPPLPRDTLTTERLAGLIGGVGFEDVFQKQGMGDREQGVGAREQGNRG